MKKACEFPYKFFANGEDVFLTNYQSTGASMDNSVTSFVCALYDLAAVVVVAVAKVNVLTFKVWDPFLSC